MKLKEKLEAVNFRKAGKSYSEIRQKIKVSKGTLSLWLRDIDLTSKQKERLYITLRQKNAYRLAKANQEKKIKKITEITKAAKNEFPSLTQNSLFLSGLMLYWAEGDKSDITEHVKFTNSDPILIQLMMRWFRHTCKVPESKFRITLHIHTLHCRPDIEKYWSKITKIPINQFYKTQIKPTSLRQRRNPLYNGTCAISIQNKDLFRRIKGWKLGFIKKFGIKIRPRSSMDRTRVF